jgi:hypothetical protein
VYDRHSVHLQPPRYDRLLRLLDSTRDYEDEQQVARIEGFKVGLVEWRVGAARWARGRTARLLAGWGAACTGLFM